MAQAIEVAALLGNVRVEAALAAAALAGRFAEGDLASILEHQAAATGSDSVVAADERFSIQAGTATWAGFGR